MRKEKTIDFHIKWAWHSISRMYNTHAAQYGMTMAVGYVLLNIDLEKGTPATKIAPLLGMEPRSLVRMLKNLEEKGLIRREVSGSDKRFVRIILTEEGKVRREQAREGVITFNQMIREKIPLEKLVVFLDVIKEINHIVEEENQKLKAGEMPDEL
ncbi:MarR family winged helix-turn-helix transcriptional regulator [Arundinibacter roseus]|uniref:MarR family transcriptional regulator n=1 Tax=Arundinibacter roseus TaxID=2070510 RepID=A0A4R4KDI7_9BACT|nr:MarR family transcriptional regulator [Arundinibacter roseus]TDB65987.1 MarR family transcriptional regulator [Arundinibacter roseus]